METVSEEVPEVIHEEAMATRVEQQPSSEMTLNAGNGNGFEELPYQNSSLMTSTASTASAIVNAIYPEEATREIERLNLELTAARKRIAEQDATIRKQDEQLKQAGESVQKQGHGNLEKLNKLVEQGKSQTLEKEDGEEFYRFKNSLKSLAEPYFVLMDKEALSTEGRADYDKIDKMCFDVMNKANGMYQTFQALLKIDNLQISKATTAAPAEPTTATAIPTTNEEVGVLPPSQPINDGDAVEHGEMYGNVQVLPVAIVDGNGDASRGDASLLSPLPADPSQALVSDDDDDDDDDDEMGEE